MDIPRLSVREAMVGLTVALGHTQRDPARRMSGEWDDIVTRRNELAQYVHDHGIDGRFLEGLVATIPKTAYGPVIPELPFEMEEPPEHKKRWIAPAILVEPPLADVVALHPQPMELPADMPEEQVA